jgi:hypothetical protein
LVDGVYEVNRVEWFIGLEVYWFRG